MNLQSTLHNNQPLSSNDQMELGDGVFYIFSHLLTILARGPSPKLLKQFEDQQGCSRIGPIWSVIIDEIIAFEY